MKYAAVIVVHESDGIVTLVDDVKGVIAVSDAVHVRDIARDLLSVIDSLCVTAGIARGDVTTMTVQSVLGESAITQRALRTITSVFSYAQKTLKS